MVQNTHIFTINWHCTAENRVFNAEPAGNPLIFSWISLTGSTPDIGRYALVPPHRILRLVPAEGL